MAGKKTFVSCLMLTAVVAFGSISIASAEDGWESLFDGKTLKNWDGNPAFWSVRDGAITGQTTKENPTKGNTFIIHRGGDVGDFELKLEYKIVGGNSGIQYRSFEPKDTKWVIGGYQADFEAGNTYSGILYGERFRGILANRGLKTELTRTDGKFQVKTLEKLGDSAEIQKKIKKEDWNDYHITAKGFHFIHRINGVVTSECIDNDEEQRRSSGLLALQLHAGPPMTVQFRNIRIKKLEGKKTAAVDALEAEGSDRPFSGQASVAPSQHKRVAFVAGVRSHGYGSHEHKAGSILLARKLEAAMPNVKTVVHTDGWPKNREALDGFDCIVMYCDGGGRHVANPNLGQIDRYALAGVGIVCIHYGVEVPIGPSGEAFLKWIGGYFEPHWSVNPHWTAKFTKFPKHPTTRGVKPFATNDEWYYHMRFRPDMEGVTPILTDLPPASTLVNKDGSLARPENAHNNNPHARAALLDRKEPQHVAWAATRKDGGRGFGFTGGHNHWNWGNPQQLKLMLNAIAWCAKSEVPEDGVPVSEVTLDELKKNQDSQPKAGFSFASIQEQLDEWNGRKTLPLHPAAKASLKPVPEKTKPVTSGVLFQSPIVNRATKGHAVEINVDLKGAKKVYLVASDGGDGFGCDWVCWVDPRFVTKDGDKSVTELKWKSAGAGFGKVSLNKNCQGKAAMVGGKVIEKCIGTHTNSIVEYDVPAGATHFKALGALDDAGTAQGCGSTVQFAVTTTRPSLEGAAPSASPASHERADALAQLDVAEGLEASLFAAEPLMANPVNMDIDHLGRVWIVEVVNYRRFRNKDHKERRDGDRILIIEDKDGDGKAETTHVFWQDKRLNKGHGLCVLPSLDGKSTRVIVSCADRIFSVYDDDGDLKGDRVEPMFVGDPNMDHDHGLHAFVFGPDGKLYFNFGNTGTRLTDKDGKPVVDLAGNVVNNSRKPYQEGMVFRCDLDGSNVETLGWNFRNNWEISVDSFGTLWQSDNDDDGNRGTRINFVMEYGNYGYKDEFTGAGWKTPRTNLEKSIPLQHWHLNDPGVIPNLVQTGAGSPTGIMVYEGNMLAAPFANQVIHCDAGPNIVRAYPAQTDGAGYSAYIQNMLHGARDNWFRPSDVCAAPDGSVIIADWYDPGVGGHRMQDVQRGRLFRITAPGVKKYAVPKLDLSTIEGAITALQSPNLVTRYLAWTKLHSEGDKAEAALVSLFEESDNPRFRARALWVLGKIKGKGAHYVEAAITNRNADIRIVGLRLARQLKLDLIPIVRKLVNDKSSAVRRECAIALRFIDSSDKARLWAQLAAQHDGRDRWYLEALGIGAGKHWDACLTALFENEAQKPESERIATATAQDIVWRSRATNSPDLLKAGIGRGLVADEDVPRMMRAFDFLSGEKKNEALFDLAFGYSGKGDQKRADFVNSEAIKRLGGTGIKKNDSALAALNKMLDRFSGQPQFVTLVSKFEMSDRYPALLELAIANADGQLGVDSITALLGKNQLQLVEQSLNHKEEKTALATVQVIALSGHGGAVAPLLKIVQNEDKSLVLRRESAKAVAASRNGAMRLVSLAKAEKLDPALAPAVASKLHSAQWKDVRDQAAKLFPLPPTKGAKPLPPIAELVARKGAIELGRKAFETTGKCATCHIVNGKGKEVGPDLSGIGAKLSRSAMFESIIFPSAGISHNYELYSVFLEDGNVVNGLMTSSTDESVTIKNAEAIARTIPRTEIDQIIKQKISIMPADLQKLLTEKDLVDVVEYLQTLRKPVKPATATTDVSTPSKRLQAKIDVSFKRTPLIEAAAAIGKKCEVEVTLDGNSMKSEGYTRNMPVNVQAEGVTGVEALNRIIGRFEELVVIEDRTKNRVLVTTKAFVQKNGLAGTVLAASK